MFTIAILLVFAHACLTGPDVALEVKGFALLTFAGCFIASFFV
jgi:hypothetical protein